MTIDSTEAEEHPVEDAYSAALRKAEDQLDAAEKQSGLGSQDVVVALKNLGALLNDMDRFPEALGYFIRAREMLEEHFGANHPLMSDVIAGIGENYLRQSMLSEAQMYFAKALSLREAIGRGKDLHSGMLLVKIGEMDCIQSDFVNAKSHLQRALEIFVTTKSGGDEVMGDVNHNLGVIAATQESFSEAVPYLEKAVRYRESVYGAHSGEVSQSHWVLASALEALGDGARAREHFYLCAQIREEVYGSSDPATREAFAKVEALAVGGASPADALPRSARKEVVHVTPATSDAVSDSEIFVHLLSAAVLLMETGRVHLARGVLEQCLAHFGVTELRGEVDLHAVIRGLAARYPEIKLP